MQAPDPASQEHRQQKFETLLEKLDLGRKESELVLLTIRPVRWLTGWWV